MDFIVITRKMVIQNIDIIRILNLRIIHPTRLIIFGFHLLILELSDGLLDINLVYYGFLGN